MLSLCYQYVHIMITNITIIPGASDLSPLTIHPFHIHHAHCANAAREIMS